MYSCAGYIVAVSIFFIDLCVSILNSLIESMSSPQNSILIPTFSFVAISTIPPLTLNCPLPSIKSYLEYPKLTNFCFNSSKL